MSLVDQAINMGDSSCACDYRGKPVADRYGEAFETDLSDGGRRQTMVAIEVKGNDVTIRVIGHHKIWALKHVIHIKKQHIRFAGRAEPGLLPPWIRCPGTCVPRLICAGTYYGKG